MHYDAVIGLYSILISTYKTFDMHAGDLDSVHLYAARRKKLLFPKGVSATAGL